MREEKDKKIEEYNLVMTDANFLCIKCGKCCREYEDEEGVEGGIFLFEWEKNKLEQNAKILGINLNVKPSAIYKIGKIYVADGYMIKEKPCPFLKDNLCSIYEDRPTICKTFPVILFEFDPNKRGFDFVCVPRCTAFDESLKDKIFGHHVGKEYLKFIIDYFGKEKLLLENQKQITFYKIQGIIKRLNGEEPRIYSKLPEEEKSNLIIYPLFTFCKKNNILTKKEIKSLIEEHENLADVKSLSDIMDSLDTIKN